MRRVDAQPQVSAIASMSGSYPVPGARQVRQRAGGQPCRRPASRTDAHAPQRPAQERPLHPGGMRDDEAAVELLQIRSTTSASGGAGVEVLVAEPMHADRASADGHRRPDVGVERRLEAQPAGPDQHAAEGDQRVVRRSSPVASTSTTQYSTSRHGRSRSGDRVGRRQQSASSSYPGRQSPAHGLLDRGDRAERLAQVAPGQGVELARVDVRRGRGAVRDRREVTA